MTAISLSIRQAADSTGVSESTLRKAINLYPKNGGLRAKYVGVKLIILTDDLKAWVESLENARD